VCCSCSSVLVWAMGVVIDDVESGDEYGLLPRVGMVFGWLPV